MTTGPTAAIVVGVDGSLQSLHAVDWATREAVARRCPLRIVHAFLWPLLNVPTGPPAGGPPDAGLRNAAEGILAAAADRARRVAPALEISTDLPVCSPAAALVEASHEAGLVVVGHRGLGGFTGLLVGSVGVQTAAHADCPVVVVRGSNAVDPGPAVGRVVVGVDGSPLSDLAIDFAFSHAALHGLSVAALHVQQRPHVTVPGDQPLPGPDGEDRGDHETRLLTDALAGYDEKYPGVPVHRKIELGRPSEVLVAESAGAALTVVGSRAAEAASPACCSARPARRSCSTRQDPSPSSGRAPCGPGPATRQPPASTSRSTTPAANRPTPPPASPPTTTAATPHACCDDGSCDDGSSIAPHRSPGGRG